MTSPASASFPWSQAPEPPSGEFRSGHLPSGIDGDYLAARGVRPGPALLLLVGPEAGYAAVHGLFHLAAVLDARRLAGSLLIRVANDGDRAHLQDLLEVADGLVNFQRLRPGWRELSLTSYAATGSADVDHRAEQMAVAAGAPYCYGRAMEDEDDPVAWMAQRGRIAIRWRAPTAVEERLDATERVFQGVIDVLRAFGMLDGQLSPSGSRPLQPPANALAPTAGFWSPAARPGQRLRIDDKLGSFHDLQGHELGNLLTNISGILLGVSDVVRVEPGQPVAELARPVE